MLKVFGIAAVIVFAAGARGQEVSADLPCPQGIWLSGKCQALVMFSNPTLTVSAPPTPTCDNGWELVLRPQTPSPSVLGAMCARDLRPAKRGD